MVELQRGAAATVAVPVAHRKPSYCAKREAAEYKSRTKPKKGPQIFAAVSVSTGCLSYGICMAYTSSAIPSMMDSALHLSDSQASWMSSLLALGAMFGSLSAVFLMDAVGRKASLLAFSVMSLFIGWTMMMAASQPWQLYVGRFLLGLGAGLEITISPVYIHETTMRDMRDICGSFPQVCLFDLMLFMFFSVLKFESSPSQNICMYANVDIWYLGVTIFGPSCAALGGPFPSLVIATCVLKRDICFPTDQTEQLKLITSSRW